MRPFHSWHDFGLAEFPASFKPVVDVVDVTVVLPCLNEEESVAGTVTEARRVMHKTGLTFEVIVVDNGSVDESRHEATRVGASVVREEMRGYGTACRAGLNAANGRRVILGDADGTYDFSAIPRMLELLDDGADLVLGNRLTGTMEDGAMPWLHRHLGTPIISSLINRLFGAGVGDVNCGLRAMSRSAYRRLSITATGMEFASEMVVQAAQNDLLIAETPVNYRLRSGGVPKLRTWHDGWRHLRLVFESWSGSRTRTSGSAVSPVRA